VIALGNARGMAGWWRIWVRLACVDLSRVGINAPTARGEPWRQDFRWCSSAGAQMRAAASGHHRRGGKSELVRRKCGLDTPCSVPMPVDN